MNKWATTNLTNVPDFVAANATISGNVTDEKGLNITKSMDNAKKVAEQTYSQLVKAIDEMIKVKTEMVLNKINKEIKDLEYEKINGP